MRSVPLSGGVLASGRRCSEFEYESERIIDGLLLDGAEVTSELVKAVGVDRVTSRLRCRSTSDRRLPYGYDAWVVIRGNDSRARE